MESSVAEGAAQPLTQLPITLYKTAHQCVKMHKQLYFKAQSGKVVNRTREEVETEV